MSLYLREHLTYDQARVQILHEGEHGKDLYMKGICIQGGMKPELLFESEKRIMEETDKYLEIFKDNPYVFNLGHGILPNTNPEVIKKIVNKVRLIKR